jgi:hypothetical protein
MSGFILVGGSALSLQLGHRLSEDLDFWLPADSMSKPRVDNVLSNLAVRGHHHELVTPAWKISQARINGMDILAQSRDHVIDGVKVTFFARNDLPYQRFSRLRCIDEDGVAFQIMHQDSIFEMKSWLVSQRVKSRDLFDLMVLVRDHGKTLHEILEAGLAADPGFQPEYAKEVLVGNVSVDADDEGFGSIGLNTSIEAIYNFFLEQINEYEVNFASSIEQRITASEGKNSCQ